MFVIVLAFFHLSLFSIVIVFSTSEWVCMLWLLGLVFVYLYLCIVYLACLSDFVSYGYYALCICVFVFVYLCIWHVWVSLYVMATRPCASCQSICPLTQSWSQLLGTTWRRCFSRDLYLSCVKTTLTCDGFGFGALAILLGFVDCKGVKSRVKA